VTAFKQAAEKGRDMEIQWNDTRNLLYSRRPKSFEV